MPAPARIVLVGTTGPFLRHGWATHLHHRTGNTRSRVCELHVDCSGASFLT